MKCGSLHRTLLLASLALFALVGNVTQLASFYKYADDNSFAFSPSRSVSLEKGWIEDTWTTVTRQAARKLPNVLARRSTVAKDDITLTVHTGPTMKGLNRMLFLIHRWGGPVSVAIRVTSLSEIQIFQDFVTQHLDQLPQAAIHLLMESPNNEYPHNILREMAMEQTETDYFLALDVDFMTITHCHEKLKMLLLSDLAVVKALHNKTMMVMPAFNHEVHLKDDQLHDSVLPSTKEDALKMVAKYELTPFHVKRFFPGHGPTDFDKWYSEDFDGSWYPIKYAMRYEPYVLGYKPGIPHYWEGFRGFGFNKLSWFIELHYMGYNFGVLRDFFVIHLDHPYTKFAAKPQAAYEVDRFQDYLVQEYGADRKALPGFGGWPQKQRLKHNVIKSDRKE